MNYYAPETKRPDVNHKPVEVWFGCVERKTPEDAIAAVRAAAEGVVCPRIRGNYVVGWAPMTEQEIAAAKKRRAATAKANAARREKQKQKELALLRSLAEKHGVALGEDT